MPSLPGSKLWDSALMGYVQVTDWDLNNGGVIKFRDGTLWSYEGESPAFGDQDKGDFPYYGFCISERKPGSDAWERLTPDVWGLPESGAPPGWPFWPRAANENDWLNPSLTNFGGPLDLAPIGSNTSGWCHVQDGDDVWFYPRFGDEGLGPVKVNRLTRQWERFVDTTAAQDIWQDCASNMVMDSGYLWFLAFATSAQAAAGKGMRLVRVPMQDPSLYTVMHQWDDPVGWDTGLITSNLTIPDFIDNQYLTDRVAYSIAIDGGYMYYFTHHNEQLGDSRTVNGGAYNDPSSVNYNMKYSMLRRTKIGDYTLETLIWHTSPQGFIGYGASNSYGTGRDATIGITTHPDLTGAYSGGSGDFEAIGMGMKCSGEDDMQIHNGWLYWADWSGHNFGVYGDPQMLCRVQLSKLTPGTPIRHDPLDPIFEIVTNGTVPWEGNAGHWGRGGTWIWRRDGSQPIMAHADNTWSFDEEGNILFKAMAFPLYYSQAYGYGLRGIWKLTQPTVETNVTVSFVGDELQGYGNVRQVPMTRGVIEVELS